MNELRGSSRSLAYEQRFKQNIEKQSKNNMMRQEEKGCSAELNIRGRKAFFEEYFDNIKLEDQIIPSVGPIEDPRITESFKNGYQRGKLLVKNGFDNDKYQLFLEEFEEKYPSEKTNKHR